MPQFPATYAGGRKMTASATKWARGCDLARTEKAVLLALASYYSPRHGYSAPTQSQLAADTGLARETILRVARRIEKAGHIAIVKSRKKGQWERCHYLLNPLGGGIKSRSNHVTPRHLDHVTPTKHGDHVTPRHTSREKGYAGARSQVIQLRQTRNDGGDA